MTRKQTNTLLFQALRLRQQGLTLEKIGKKLEISTQLARQWICKAQALETAYKQVMTRSRS